jgi:phosphoserine phosphatase
MIPAAIVTLTQALISLIFKDLLMPASLPTSHPTLPLAAFMHRLRYAFAALLLLAMAATALAADPLPSWRESPSKKGINDFVARVTNTNGPDYVSPAERIAVFDNDGTLWAENPMYFQVLFAFERLRQMAPQHPEWNDDPILKAVIDGDMKGAFAKGEHGLIDVVTLTHEGDVDAFRAEAKLWLMNARHPQTKLRYTEMVYQPMLELLAYLRSQSFKVYIVSGGDVEFIRAFAERVYGIPPEQVIGSRIGYALDNNTAARTRKLKVLNDKEEKVLSIAEIIGRRPILAYGNSDGDLAMIEYTKAGKGARFGAIVHHTDAAREFAYDRTSKVGRLNKALDVSKDVGIVITDMARDWATVYPVAAK